MALGGVETGSAEPKLAPNVTPINGGSGSMEASSHSAITTGISAVAVAALLVNSLRTIAPAMATAVISQMSPVPRVSGAVE